MASRRTRLLAIVGPGILVAATGVGAGDLATGALAGSKLGLTVLWAVLVAAGLKWLVNEGLARWQLATGTTLVEGCVLHLGRPVQWLFLGYLLVWSFFVGAAMMGACGVTAHAICPLWEAPTDKIVYGLAHSALAVLLVRLGGYRLFGTVMSACIAVMFVVVVATAVAVGPSWGEVARGLVEPRIPDLRGEGLQWTVALIGGIGGTVTVLCYGYWIREEGRTGAGDLAVCRIDLAVGYAMTAVFGVAMVIIGRTVQVTGGGATLIVDLAEQLRLSLGPAARWAFLAGAWGAIFSSLLGVWQSVPYLFADFWNLMRDPRRAASGRNPDTRSLPYQGYLLGLAVIPAAGLLWTRFQDAQKWYAIVGALFIPMLAAALLALNGRSALVGRRYRNSRLVTLALVATLALSVLVVWFAVHKAVSSPSLPSA